MTSENSDSRLAGDGTFVVTCVWPAGAAEYRIADEANASGMYEYLRERGAQNVTLWTAFAYNHTAQVQA